MKALWLVLALASLSVPLLSATDADVTSLEDTLSDGSHLAFKEIRTFPNCGLIRNAWNGDSSALRLPSIYDSEIAFSPDGKLLAVAKDDGIELLEIATGLRVRSLQFPALGTRAERRSIAFSPNGEYVAFGLNGRAGGTIPLTREINIWELASGRSSPSSMGQVNQLPFTWPLEFSPQGECLFYLERSRVAQIKDRLRMIPVKGGQCPHEPHFQGNNLTNFSLSPNGALLAASQGDKVVWFSLGSGKALGELTGFQGNPGSTLFAPDGKSLVTSEEVRGGYLSDKSSNLMIWDLSTAKPVRRISGPSSVHWSRDSIRAVGFSQDGSLLYSVEAAESTSNWKIWSPSTGKEVLPGTKTTVDGKISFSPVSNRIAVINYDKKLGTECNAIYGYEETRVIRILEAVVSPK